MADLTSTITITGAINGRKISITSTCDYENILDAGIAQADDHQLSDTIIGFGTTNAMNFAQDCPDYLFMVNRSPSETCVLQMQNAATTVDYRLLLPATAFAIISQYQNGAGIIMSDNSATNITLEEITKAQASTVDDIGFVCKADLMVAFQSAS